MVYNFNNDVIEVLVKRLLRQARQTKRRRKVHYIRPEVFVSQIVRFSRSIEPEFKQVLLGMGKRPTWSQIIAISRGFKRQYPDTALALEMTVERLRGRKKGRKSTYNWDLASHCHCCYRWMPQILGKKLLYCSEHQPLSKGYFFMMQKRKEPDCQKIIDNDSCFITYRKRDDYREVFVKIRSHSPRPFSPPKTVNEFRVWLLKYYPYIHSAYPEASSVLSLLTESDEKDQIPGRHAFHKYLDSNPQNAKSYFTRLEGYLAWIERENSGYYRKIRNHGGKRSGAGRRAIAMP